MTITAVQVGPLGTNCYLVTSEKGNTLIIDPGAEPETIVRVMARNGLRPVGILLTHGHNDHIGAVEPLRNALSLPVRMHRNDAQALQNPPDDYLEDGDRYSLDELDFEVMAVPGHTPGCVMFQCGSYLFSGDTLFAGSVGRVDLPGGNGAQMWKSLQRIVQHQWNDTIVLPGHGPETSMELEMKRNPFLLQVMET